MVMDKTLPPLIQNLMQPDAYDHAVSHIELVETHISWVLLTGSRAYKIKKPVNLGFLDFSTLEKRHFFCDEELRLNRRSAPELYLAVATINGDALHAKINGPGPVLDYAVTMRQFAPTCRLDNYLRHHALETETFATFARYLAQFHDQSAVAGSADNYGSFQAINHAVMENFAQIGQILHSTPSALMTQVQQWSQQRGAQLQAAFDARKRALRIRECHGDMHLANLVLMAERITLFDGIEFNAELRWIDVINDIAFLVMDLQHCGYRRHANTFLNAYLMHSGDFAGLELLDYYKTYRAMVRAKVAMIQASQHRDKDPEFQRLQAECSTYLRLASSYTQHNRPRMLLTVGYSGSGKTTVASELAWRMEAVHLRSDVERKRLAGLSAYAVSDAAYGQKLYDHQSTDATYRRLLEVSTQLLGWGYTVIVDATFLTPERRDEFHALAQRHHAGMYLLHLSTSPDELHARVAARAAGRDISEAGPEVLAQQLRQPLIWRPQEHALRMDIDTGHVIDYEALVQRLMQDT